MRFVTLALLLCVLLIDVSAQKAHEISIGHIEKIESGILGETRDIWVHVPGGDDDIYLPQKYPVVYLLDGDAHFRSVVGMIHQLSSVNGNTLCPQMIVVGIPNVNRTRDLTPIKGTPDNSFSDSTMIAQSGGGEEFLSFIEQELMPHIESNYPTLPYRTLIGHSLGGLMAVHALVHHTEMFNAYVAIDPSMWWADGSLLNDIRSGTINSRYDGRSLVLGIANTMDRGMDTAMVRMDTTDRTEHIRSILDLNDYMQQNAGDHLQFFGRYYPEDGHGSVALITEYDGLRFIFKPFQIEWEMEDFMDPSSDIAGKMQSHYEKLSETYGFQMLPGERDVNTMAYQFMGMEQMDKAGSLFKLNVKNYPTSHNVYDSIGDYYSVLGNKEKALAYYQKSVAIRPDSPSKDKLVKLQE